MALVEEKKKQEPTPAQLRALKIAIAVIILGSISIVVGIWWAFGTGVAMIFAGLAIIAIGILFVLVSLS
jgi:uncharacterized membrane protein